MSESIVELYNILIRVYESELDRRIKMNQFYFTISASVTVATSFVLLNKKAIMDAGIASILLNRILFMFAFMVLVINVSWMSYIRAHSKLQEAQFEVMKIIEKELPYPLFTTMTELYAGKVGMLNRTFSERLIPLSFLFFGLTLLAQVLTN